MIFDAACEMPSAEREPFLDKECGDDNALRAEVESLLEHHFTQANTVDPPTTGEAIAPSDVARISEGDAPDLSDVIKHIPERWKIGLDSASGGMGSVFSAHDTMLDRRVAIKLLHHTKDDPQSHEKILSEARALAALQHPSIATIHEVVLEEGVPFIVMPWVDGVEFQTGIHGMEMQEQLAILRKLITAVELLHLRRIIHGDIKPRNILIDRNHNPVLVDFGLAHGTCESHDKSYGGTPGFSAPEQFVPRVSVGLPADVYAIGVLLFTILCDRLPFNASTSSELINKTLTEDPPLPQKLNPKVPAGLQAICLKSLERDPELRYQTASELLADLDRYLAGESVAARPSLLTDKFLTQVDEQVEEVRAWRRQELVTRLEANKLINLLRRIRQPESAWLLDSRRLSPSQVLFYLGSWMLLVSVTVCFYFMIRTEAISESLQWMIPGGLVVIAVAIFVWMYVLDQRRFVLGYAMLANFLLPVAMFYLIRDQQWFLQTGSETQLAGPIETNGITNAQLLLNSSIWLAASLVFRKITHASALTIPAVLAGLVVWMSGWATSGLLDIFSDGRQWGFFGLGIAVAGFVSLIFGMRLNAVEGRDEYELGHRASRRGDAWPISSVGVAMIVAGLGVAAWNWSAFFFYLGPALSDNLIKQRSTAFFIVAVVLWLITCLLDRTRTPLRMTLASTLRWILPTAALLPIALLAKHSWWPYTREWIVWDSLLVLGAIGFAIWSIKHQWKPFLVSGLGYLATSVFILFFGLLNAADNAFETNSEAEEWFNGVSIMATSIIVGIAAIALVISWLMPAVSKEQ